MNAKAWALGLISVSLLFGTWAKADTAVTVGQANNGTCYPFDCAASDGISLYQQIYNSSAFTDAAYITSFEQTLFTDYGFGPDLLDSATYDIGFSTTPTYSLSSNPIDNIGLDYAPFGVYSLSGLSPSLLSFTGTPFFYDPSLGNLVMTVQISDLIQPGNPYFSFYNSDDTPINDAKNQTYKCYGTATLCTPESNAPVTTFNLTRSLPAPSPLPLFGVAAAFSFSRQARRRISTSRSNP